MRRLLLLMAVLIGLAHVAGCKGVGTVCHQSGSTSECGDALICTYTVSPGTFDPNAEPPPPLSVCLRTCNTSSDCGEGELCRFVYCSAEKSCQTGPVQDPTPNLCGCEYEQDFESLDKDSATALGDDGWLFFGNVYDDAGALKFSYPNDPPSPDPAPNDSADPENVSISALVSGEDGTRRGAQQLVVSNDYNCCLLETADPQGHGNGTDRVETIVFREINPIPAEFIGEVYEFTFDGNRGNIAGATTAQAFIRTRQQQADGSFVTTNDVVFDTTNLVDAWGTYSLSLDMSDPSLQGQRLQFGFSTIASNFEDSANLYDNTTFCASAVGGGAGGTGGAGGMGGAGGTGGTAGTGGTGGTAGTGGVGGMPPSGDTVYAQDFEGLDVTPSTALTDDGWLGFVSRFSPDGLTFLGGYVSQPGQNQGGLAAIETGQGGAEQGQQQLVIISDYNNDADQTAGNRVEANTFQERTIVQDDVGKTITFSFDAKRGDIAGASTANAFIKTFFDPGTLINFLQEDTTAIPDTWNRYSIELVITGDLVGATLQFGFSATASNFEPSGNFYDNVVVTESAP